MFNKPLIYVESEQQLEYIVIIMSSIRPTEDRDMSSLNLKIF
jgi:hypothetical protein